VAGLRRGCQLFMAGLVTVGLMSTPQWVGAFAGPRVYVDGRRVPLDAPVVLVDGRAMVPARAVFEALGAEVLWDAREQRVTIVRGETQSQLWIGVPLARVDGRTLPVQPAPRLVSGRAVVPVRFAEDALGFRVVWDEASRSIRLYTGGPVVEEPVATLAFVGDVLLGYGMVETLIDRHGVHYPWDNVRSILTSADYAMANLECAISTRGQPQPRKEWTFRGKPETLEGLRSGGIDVVSLANNHTLDYGTDAFLDTLEHLDRYGVARVGGGRNLAEALRPHIWEKDGLKVGFLAATAIYPGGWEATGTRPGLLVTHYESQVMKAIRDLRETVDVVVVGVHWGVERDPMPDAYQRRYGRALVDNGAHLVIGHHPHVLQGIEVYRGALIAYSLGNFVFTRNQYVDTWDSAILLVTVDRGGVVDARVVPIDAQLAQPRPVEGKEAARILQKIRDRSRDWGVDLDAEGRLVLK